MELNSGSHRFLVTFGGSYVYRNSVHFDDLPGSTSRTIDST